LSFSKRTLRGFDPSGALTGPVLCRRGFTPSEMKASQMYPPARYYLFLHIFAKMSIAKAEILIIKQEIKKI